MGQYLKQRKCNHFSSGHKNAKSRQIGVYLTALVRQAMLNKVKYLKT